MVLSTVCAKVVNSVFRAMVKNREIYSIGHSGKRNKWRDLVTPVSVFRGTNMRIELKQRKNWSKWQEVCIVRKSWPRSVSGSPRWSEELPAPVFTWGDQHSFCKMVTSAPGWIFTFVGLPSARWRWWQTCPLRFYSSGTLDLALKRLRLFLCPQPK